MATFVATYRYIPDVDALARLRPERYTFFRRLEDEGILLASGQLVDGDLGDGMLVVLAADVAAAAAALDADPFVREGLVAQRSLARWTVTAGSWSAG